MTDKQPQVLKLIVDLHAHEGDGFVTKESIPTEVWITPSEIQVHANESQKIGISRQHGNLTVHFWLNGNTGDSCPDKVAILREGGFVFKDWDTEDRDLYTLYKEE